MFPLPLDHPDGAAFDAMQPTRAPVLAAARRRLATDGTRTPARDETEGAAFYRCAGRTLLGSCDAVAACAVACRAFLDVS